MTAERPGDLVVCVLRPIVRVAAFAEAAGALYLWGRGALDWPVALLIWVPTLLGAWITFPEPHEPGAQSERVRITTRCRVFGHAWRQGPWCSPIALFCERCGVLRLWSRVPAPRRRAP